MTPFTYDALAGRVVFGPGRVADVPAEVTALGCERVLLVADAGAAAIGDQVAGALDQRMARRWDEVVQHVPVELAERARAAAVDAGADAVVCVGGGSATGLAKAVALTTGLAVVAVPTTYAGSEMTPIYGMTGEHKQTGRDLRVQPRVVVYDPELTLRLPGPVTAASAFNALAHCVEGLYAPGANPITSLMAVEGIAAIGRSVAAAVAEGGDLDARTDLLYGAYLAGAVLAVTGVALHHRACHVLGGTFGLDHGQVNTVILPHAVAYNTPAVPELMEKVAGALGQVPGAAESLYDLAAAVGAPTSLAEIGMPADGLDEAAERTVAETTHNPQPVDRAGVRALLQDAYDGRRPTSDPGG